LTAGVVVGYIKKMKTVNDIAVKLLVLLRNSTVRTVWERKASDLDAVLRDISILKNFQPQKLEYEGR
jgi:hypothetical protein